jgi:hypothetical protein
MWGGSIGTNSMNGMMGQTGATRDSANPLLPYFGVLFATAISKLASTTK